MSSTKFYIVGEAYVDYFCFLAGKLPRAGEDSVLEQPMQSYPGGSPINTATHLQALLPTDSSSFQITVQTVLNEDDSNGKLLLHHAASHQFQLVNCRPENYSSGGTAAVTPHCVIVVTGDDRTFMTHRGCATSWSAEDLELSTVPCHVHIAGFYCTPGFGGGSLRQTIERWKRENPGSVTVSLVTQYDVTEAWDGGLVADLIPLLDIVIMNEQEATSVMKGSTIHGVETMEEDELVATWLSFYAEPNVLFVVTMGDKGAVAFRNQCVKCRHRIQADNLTVVDPTGAGDAFAAGFLYGYYQLSPAGDIQRAMKWGCSVGAAAVTVRGASVDIPTETLQELLEDC